MAKKSAKKQEPAKADQFHVGRVVRCLRAESVPTVTVEDLADRSGWSKGHISAVERGINNPTWKFVEDVVVALGITLEKFVSEYNRIRAGDKAALAAK